MLGNPSEGWKRQDTLYDGYHAGDTENECYFIGVRFTNVHTNQIAWLVWSWPRNSPQRGFWLTEDENFVCEHELSELEKCAALEVTRRWPKTDVPK